MLPIASAVTFHEDCNVAARNARSLMYLLAKQKTQPLKESMVTGSLLLSAAVLLGVSLQAIGQRYCTVLSPTVKHQVSYLLRFGMLLDWHTCRSSTVSAEEGVRQGCPNVFMKPPDMCPTANAFMKLSCSSAFSFHFKAPRKGAIDIIHMLPPTRG
eukprot:gene7622-biopygen14271